MKKIITLLIVCALVYPVFAQVNDNISLHAFAAADFEPVQMVKKTGEDPEFHAGSGSWMDVPHVGIIFSLFTSDKKLGGLVDFAYGNGTPSVGDNAELWVQPFDWLKLDVGKFQIDTLRGKYGVSDFAKYIGPMEEEDAVFQRFTGATGSGVLVSITPTDSLFFGFLINPEIGARYNNYDDPRAMTPRDVYQNGQYAVGYTLWSLGQFRLQYIGGDFSRLGVGVNSPSDQGYLAVTNEALGDDRAMSFQAAFTYWKTPGLIAEVGFTYPLYVKDTYGSLQRPLKFALTSKYTLGNLTLGGRVDGSFAGKQSHDKTMESFYDGPSIGGNFIPSYNFGFASLGADISLKYNSSYTLTYSYLGADHILRIDETMLFFGAGLWIMKEFDNGYFKTGVGFSAPTKSIPGSIEIEKSPVVITIPIIFNFYI